MAQRLRRFVYTEVFTGSSPVTHTNFMKIIDRPLTDDEVQEVLNIAKKIEEVVDKLGLHMRNYASLPTNGYDYERFTQTNFIS